MSECKDCVFFTPKSEGYTLDKCGYPVPVWLENGPVGPFVYGHEAERCRTFRDRASLVSVVPEK